MQAFIHPQQQFASTLYQDIDKYPHLDIVTKLGFVQHYLSRLRNRATEVETLTSGPGIVFTVSNILLTDFLVDEGFQRMSFVLLQVIIEVWRRRTSLAFRNHAHNEELIPPYDLSQRNGGALLPPKV